MIVEVIVDIPNAQVNRPFDYLVPEEWEEELALGQRVQVPFGPRQILGFIVGFKETSDFTGQLRPLTRVLDYESFLTPELIDLSQVLSEDLHAFRITVLQAMLPSMLKVNYRDYFDVLDLKAFQERTNQDLLAPDRDRYLRSDLEEVLEPKLIKDLLAQDILELTYEVQDQTTVQTISYVVFKQTKDYYQEALAELDKRSYRQAQLLEYILQLEELSPLAWSQVQAETGLERSHLNTAQKKGWIAWETHERYRDPYLDRSFIRTQARSLLPEQAQAYECIAPSVTQKEAETFLLEGVTGSGKTEVYLQLMALAREGGRGAILLVPEIALTPQMVRQVKERFEEGVAVLHSGLSVSERYDEWRRIVAGEATIVVGARSSIFAPIANLGLIIIDEEHESTYKQSTMPRYHARDVALWRSHYHQAPVVLGSATPSLESRARAQVDKYHLVTMDQRINQNPLPPVELVDMTQVYMQGGQGEVSPLLQEKIQERLDRKEQIVLLLNRRGYSSYLLCRSCGEVIGCPHCDISLTYHKFDQSLRCHYCDYRQPLPKTCPSCGSQGLRPYGLGTQKVQETLEELFPEAGIIRMDVDTTRRKGQHEQLLAAFERHEADILLGTQMIAKGLDFGKVTLVGVINADTALNLPDFRAGEKTFQLLTQVAGRTGRADLPGEVVIQTYNPDHYVMAYVQTHDYETFFKYEMHQRHLANYPPYYFTTLLTVSSKNRQRAQSLIYDLRSQLHNPQAEAHRQLIVVGPSPGTVAKIKDTYHFNLLLKYKNKDLVQAQLTQILEETQALQTQGLYVSIDHEPLFFN